MKQAVLAIPEDVAAGRTAATCRWRAGCSNRRPSKLRLSAHQPDVLPDVLYAAPNTSITAGVAAGRVTAVIDRNAKFDSANTREFQLQLRIEWQDSTGDND